MFFFNWQKNVLLKPRPVGDNKLSQGFLCIRSILPTFLDTNDLFAALHEVTSSNCLSLLSFVILLNTEDYEQLVEDIVRDGRLYASENHQEILKVCTFFFLLCLFLVVFAGVTTRER